MLKRCVVLLFLVLAGATLPMLAAAKSKQSPSAKAKTVVRVGDKWGGDKEAQLSIVWNDYGENEVVNEGLVRQPFVDVTRSKIFGSVVPLTQKQLLESVYFTVKMSATRTGKVTACSLKRAEYDSAAVPRASTYFCSYMVKQGYIHPPLNMDGERIAVTGFFEASYSSDTQFYSIVQTGPDGKELVDQRKAAPTVPITLASLNLANIPATSKGKKATLFIEIAASGEITKCRLFEPTFIDSIDAQLCSRTADLNFVPALDHKGFPTADSYFQEFQF